MCWSHPAWAGPGPGLECVPGFFEAVPALPQGEEENCMLFSGEGVGSALGHAAFSGTGTADGELGQICPPFLAIPSSLSQQMRGAGDQSP